ncbi:MAG: type I secretion protein TolC, partial [Gammaproteobacteria bacterium]
GFNSNNLLLSITQPIYRKDLVIQLGQAKDQVRQADVTYASARQDLMVRVAQRYFDVLSAKDELEFAHASKEAIYQQLQQSRQRFEVGLIAITDVEEAQAGFDLAVAGEIAAVNQVDNAREALREVIGRYEETLAPLGKELPLVVPDPDDIEAWTQTALEKNLSLQAANMTVDVAFAEIQRIRAGHLPTVDLVGAHDRTDAGSRLSTTETRTTSLSLQLNVPIYQGGLIMSQTRQARHLHRQAVDELERERRSAQRQTRNAFLGVRSGISRVKALIQAEVSTQSALDAIEAGFEVGTRTSVDVLGAQRELFRARRDLAAARYAYILDILRLKQAAGTLSETDMEQISGWLAR